MYFRYFLIISPWIRAWPFIWTTWIPCFQGCFGPSLVEMDPCSGSLEEDEYVKSLRRRRQTTEKIQSEKITWAQLIVSSMCKISETIWLWNLKWNSNLLECSAG